MRVYETGMDYFTIPMLMTIAWGKSRAMPTVGVI